MEKMLPHPASASASASACSRSWGCGNRHRCRNLLVEGALVDSTENVEGKGYVDGYSFASPFIGSGGTGFGAGGTILERGRRLEPCV